MVGACASPTPDPCPPRFERDEGGSCVPASRSADGTGTGDLDATDAAAPTQDARDAARWSDGGSPSPWTPPESDALSDATEAGDATRDDAGSGACAWQARLRISEVLFDPAGVDGPAEFVELAGPVGTPIDGARLVAVNGANGDPYGEIELAGSIGVEGWFVIGGEAVEPRDADAPFALQNGPDALVLVSCDGEVVDALAYGPPDASAGEGSGAGAEGSGEAEGGLDGAGEGALARVEAGRSAMRCGLRDTDDNADDFVAGIPTPGAPNRAEHGDCDAAPCTGLPAGAVRINEVRYDPPGADGAGEREFIELHAASGAQTSGLSLYLVNGSDGEPYADPIPVPGWESNPYVVIGGTAISPVHAALPRTVQNGPDAIVLVDCLGEVVDALAYGEGSEGLGEGPPAADVSGDLSLGRRSGEADLDHNAADFVAFETPTPGAPNGRPLEATP